MIALVGDSAGAPTLLLFDIDGTLLSGAAVAHRNALYEALRLVHAVDAPAVGLSIHPGGRTDGEIARSILLDAGVSATRIDERAEAVQDACCQAYARLCDADLSHHLVAGIAELLEWVAGTDRARLALVTGNYEPVARLKLTRAGIGRWFPTGQGGFGSDAEDRAALPPIARRRAGQAGVSFPRERTVVIGDTPRDIACARADGLRCIAVATGPFDAEELSGADLVARSTEELRDALDQALAA